MTELPEVLRRRLPAGLKPAALVLVLVAVSTGCLHRHRARARVTPPPPAAKPAGGPGRAPAGPIVQGEEGIASWYGHPFHGRRTSNGETYNMYAMTAAHRTLPFDTRVRVHNLENGASVDVRINDRGPFVEGRIIDLSFAAAQAMHMPGTALVKLEILGYGAASAPAPPPGFFAVQVGAFKEAQNASRLKAQIGPHYGPVTVQTFDRGDGVFYRVRVGRESSEAAALELARRLRETGLAGETFVVRLD